MIDLVTLSALADRAEALYRRHNIHEDRMTILMDLDFTDRQMPLDAERLLAFSDADFAHDVLGIRQHMNRKAGILTGCFVPRCARHDAPPSLDFDHDWNSL